MMASRNDNAGGTDAAGEPHASLRVVLVGRTGLDGRLRMDPGIELARVRTPLEAVGELSEDANGAARIVIVAADADPAQTAVDGRGGNPERAREFIAALRVVDPGVRVLRLEGEDGEAPVRAGYDGVIEPDAGPELLRAMISGNADATPEVRRSKREEAAVEQGSVTLPPESAPAPEDPIPAPRPGPATPPAPAAPPEPLPDIPQKPIPVFPPSPDEEPEESPEEEPRKHEPARTPPLPAFMEDIGAEPAGAPAAAGDEGLVRMLLQGRDITDAAVDIVRKRLGGRDVVFTTAGRTGREGAAATKEDEGVSVAWRGRNFGRLRGDGLGLEELLPQASWLGSWLALRDQHAQLRDAAFTDPLTGAYNRRFFDHFLQSAIEQARAERRSLTVLMFDIDNFKMYNDLYGHAAGDEILMEAVRLLRSVIRPSDKVCRIGGDEFVVIFHEPQGPRSPSSKHPSDIAQIAHRFQREVHGHKFPKLGRDAPGTLTISGGLATYPWDGPSPEALLELADQLAIQSKKQGKNCITLGPGAEREHGGK
jgi:diguanylate cyclase (GGDEF)-like protein